MVAQAGQNRMLALQCTPNKNEWCRTGSKERTPENVWSKMPLIFQSRWWNFNNRETGARFIASCAPPVAFCAKKTVSSCKSIWERRDGRTRRATIKSFAPSWRWWPNLGCIETRLLQIPHSCWLITWGMGLFKSSLFGRLPEWPWQIGVMLAWFPVRSCWWLYVLRNDR